MTQEHPSQMHVLITSGPEDHGRAALGFAFALSAASAGVSVTVVLTLNGAAWRDRQIPEISQAVSGFPSIADTLEMLCEHGAELRVCSSCKDNTCFVDQVDFGTEDDMSYVGLTEIAVQTANGSARTVVF